MNEHDEHRPKAAEQAAAATADEHEQPLQWDDEPAQQSGGVGVEIRPGMRVEGFTTADDSCGVAGIVLETSKRGVFIRVDRSWEGKARVGSEEGIPWARLRPVPASQLKAEHCPGTCRRLAAEAAAAGQHDGPTVYLVQHEQLGTMGVDDDCGSKGIVDDARAFTPTLFLDYTAAQISAAELWPDHDRKLWRVVPVRIPRGVLPEADALPAHGEPSSGGGARTDQEAEAS